MRFAEVLPHLEAGRVCKRTGGQSTYILVDGTLSLAYEGRTEPSRSADLLASDWEVVEEPAPAKPATCEGCESWKGNWEVAHKNNDDLRATIARLTRELDQATSNLGEVAAAHLFEREQRERLTRERDNGDEVAATLRGDVDRLTRERDEARAERRCCPCCGCGSCVQRRMMTALGTQRGGCGR